MINTLIIYSTTDGQTLSICNVIIENHFNDDVKICSINEVMSQDLTKYK